MLTAYWDEIGHSASTPFAGMAGFLAPVSRWVWLETEWLSVLRATDLPFNGKPYIHMREYAHSRGPFAEWKGREEKRQQLMKDLIALVGEAEAIPIGAAVPMREYGAISGEAREGLVDPYFLALQHCVNVAASFATLAGESAAMIFDDNRAMIGRVPVLYQTLKENFMLGHGMGEIAFASMKEMAPLQVADILAFEFGGYCRHVLDHPDDKEPKGRYKMLLDITKKYRPENWPMPMLKQYGVDEIHQYASAAELNYRREEQEYASRKRKRCT